MHVLSIVRRVLTSVRLSESNLTIFEKSLALDLDVITCNDVDYFGD